MVSFTLAFSRWTFMPSVKFGRHDIALWISPFSWSWCAFYRRAGEGEWGLWFGPFTLMYDKFPGQE